MSLTVNTEVKSSRTNNIKGKGKGDGEKEPHPTSLDELGLTSFSSRLTKPAALTLSVNFHQLWQTRLQVELQAITLGDQGARWNERQTFRSLVAVWWLLETPTFDSDE